MRLFDQNRKRMAWEPHQRKKKIPDNFELQLYGVNLFLYQGTHCQISLNVVYACLYSSNSTDNFDYFETFLEGENKDYIHGFFLNNGIHFLHVTLDAWANINKALIYYYYINIIYV